MTDYDIQSLYESSQAQQAFELLVRLYGQRLYWHIRKMVISHDDANDVLQNTLVKAWTGLPRFRWESQLYTWLYRIATNEVLTFLKKDKSSLQDKLEARLEDGGPSFNGDAVQLALQKAILRLPPKQRLVFNMRYFDEMKYEEMSKILGTSEGALKASYHHAAQKVEETVKEMLL